MGKAQLEKLIEDAVWRAAVEAEGYDGRRIRHALRQSGIASATLMMLRYPEDHAVWKTFFLTLATRLERAGAQTRLEVARDGAWEAMLPAFTALRELIRRTGVKKQRVGVQYIAAVDPTAPAWLLAELIATSRDRVTVQIAAERLRTHITQGEVPGLTLRRLEEAIPMARQRFELVQELVETLDELAKTLA